MIYATHSARPSRQDRDQVLYDPCVPSYFQPDTVVPVAVTRRLVRWYALHGEWPQDVPGRPHRDLVAAS